MSRDLRERKKISESETITTKLFEKRLGRCEIGHEFGCVIIISQTFGTPNQVF